MCIDTLDLWPLWIHEQISHFLHSGSLSIERHFLFLKMKQDPASLQAEALLLSELIHQSTKMGKDERKIWRHKKKKKRFYACANLKCENSIKFTKNLFKVRLNWKAPPLSSPRPSELLLPDPGLMSATPGSHLPAPRTRSCSQGCSTYSSLLQLSAHRLLSSTYLSFPECTWASLQWTNH